VPILREGSPSVYPYLRKGEPVLKVRPTFRVGPGRIWSGGSICRWSKYVRGWDSRGRPFFAWSRHWWSRLFGSAL